MIRKPTRRKFIQYCIAAGLFPTLVGCGQKESHTKQNNVHLSSPIEDFGCAPSIDYTKWYLEGPFDPNVPSTELAIQKIRYQTGVCIGLYIPFLPFRRGAGAGIITGNLLITAGHNSMGPRDKFYPHSNSGPEEELTVNEILYKEFSTSTDPLSNIPDILIAEVDQCTDATHWRMSPKRRKSSCYGILCKRIWKTSIF